VYRIVGLFLFLYLVIILLFFKMWDLFIVFGPMLLILVVASVWCGYKRWGFLLLLEFDIEPLG
jgi:hypothetical protein